MTNTATTHNTQNNALISIYKQSYTDPLMLSVLVLYMFRQQAITWANVDSDFQCYMASPGHNELKWCQDLARFLNKPV